MVYGSILALLDGLPKLPLCQLDGFFCQFLGEVCPIEADTGKVLAKLAIYIICVWPVQSAGHVYVGMKARLRQIYVDLQPFKALNLLVVPKELVCKLWRKVVCAAQRCVTALN